MNKLFAVIVLTLTVLTSAFAKDKQSDYQIGAFVLATTNADGTLTNTLHGDGTTVAGDVYANYLKTYQVKIDTGTWTVVPLNEAQDSMVRQWGMISAAHQEGKGQSARRVDSTTTDDADRTDAAVLIH